MKKQTLSFIVGAMLLLCLGRLPAAAQDVGTVQIPFDFQVREQLLPAGKYAVKRDRQAAAWLLIQSLDGKRGVFVHIIPRTLPDYPTETGMVFRKYGGRRFLAELRLAGLLDGFALIKSKAERQSANVARAIADYDRALKINPRFANAYANRGAARLLQGDLTEAEADFARCLELGGTVKPDAEKLLRDMKERRGLR